MRLYLSSHRLGSHEEILLSLAGERKKAAIICNALDHLTTSTRLEYKKNIYDPIADFNRIGIDAEEIDLRDYFTESSRLKNDLKQYGIVWALGGNAFILRKAMRKSNFDLTIKALLENDTLLYGGFSAGAVVATSTLKGIDIMDNPNQFATNYHEEVTWDGLGLIDYSIVPHYQSNHPETALASEAVLYFERARLPYIAMRDGDVLISNNGLTTYHKAT